MNYKLSVIVITYKYIYFLRVHRFKRKTNLKTLMNC